MELMEIWKNLDATFSIWEIALEKYTLEQLLKKPDEQSWSMGQVYMHLIEQALHFNIPQLRICLQTNEHAEAQKSEEGLTVYKKNSFPNARLISAPNEFFHPAQPRSIEEIKNGFLQIRKELESLLPKIEKSAFHGKTLHPGFGHLNAEEWLQFIDLHSRHHFHQKARRDKFLLAS